MRTYLLLLALLIALDASGQENIKPDQQKFQGEWIMASEIAGGIQAPTDKIAGRKLEFQGDKYFFKSPATGGEQGTFAVDPLKKPKTMDMTPSEGPNKGKVRRAIYETSGETLKLCFNIMGGERPSAFVTERGNNTVLVVYHRAKR